MSKKKIIFNIIGWFFAIGLALKFFGVIGNKDNSNSPAKKLFADDRVGNEVGADMKWYSFTRNFLTREPEECTISKDGPKGILEMFNKPLVTNEQRKSINVDEKKIGDTVVYVSIDDGEIAWRFYRGKERCDRFMTAELEEFRANQQESKLNSDKYD